MNGEKMMYNVFKEIPEVGWQILDLSENPTTLVLDNPRNVAPNLIAPDKTLGIRLVKEPFCFKLMERMKKPLVSTSANISGQPTPKSFKEISPEIIKGVDYVVNLQHEKICDKPSTIIGNTFQNHFIHEIFGLQFVIYPEKYGEFKNELISNINNTARMK